jgi:hypothetical protein
MGTSEALIEAIEEDFKRRHPLFHKSRREALTTADGRDAGCAQREPDGISGGFAADTAIILAADRFYGTAGLIGWCQEAGWSYRIRLKGNLTLNHEGGELTTGDHCHARHHAGSR